MHKVYFKQWSLATDDNPMILLLIFIIFDEGRYIENRNAVFETRKNVRSSNLYPEWYFLFQA